MRQSRYSDLFGRLREGGAVCVPIRSRLESELVRKALYRGARQRGVRVSIRWNESKTGLVVRELV